MTSGFIFIMIKRRTYMDIHIQNLDFAYKKEIIFHQLNASLHFTSIRIASFLWDIMVLEKQPFLILYVVY